MTTCPNCNHLHNPCADSAALRRIEGDLAKLLTSVRKLTKMSEALNASEATLAADDTALKASVDKAVARLTDLAKQLADALAAASNAGATPDQLAALTKLHEDLSADAAALDTADAPAA